MQSKYLLIILSLLSSRAFAQNENPAKHCLFPSTKLADMVEAMEAKNGVRQPYLRLEKEIEFSPEISTNEQGEEMLDHSFILHNRYLSSLQVNINSSAPKNGPAVYAEGLQGQIVSRSKLFKVPSVNGDEHHFQVVRLSSAGLNVDLWWNEVEGKSLTVMDAYKLLKAHGIVAGIFSNKEDKECY